MLPVASSLHELEADLMTTTLPWYRCTLNGAGLQSAYFTWTIMVSVLPENSQVRQWGERGIA